MEKCVLDEVVFLPERRPRNKQHVTALSHRIPLIEHAIGADTAFRLLHLESEQFTVAGTLPELRAVFGQAQLTFLLGSDVVQSLPTWKGVEVLCGQASFAIGMRASDDKAAVIQVMERIKAARGTPIVYTCVDAPNAHLTSSQLREGKTALSQLPHPEMVEYIHKHRLYPQTF